MPKKRTLKAYVVREYNWEYNDEFYYHDDEGSAIQTFLDRSQAEEYRLKKEREIRDSIGPFEMNGLELEDQTSLSPEEFRARLAAAGIEMEEGEIEFEWWMEHQDELTAEQKDLVWELCDRARFYEVVETAVEVED